MTDSWYSSLRGSYKTAILLSTATLSHFYLIICVTRTRVARRGHILKDSNDKVDGDGEINDGVDSMACTKVTQARA